MNIANFKKKPILGILRGIDESRLEGLVETVIDSGLGALEITMNTAHAAQLIRKAKHLCANRLALGAGTVLTMKDLKSALSSGATFIVTPVLVKDVLKYCVKNKIPVFPGALTPQEIYQAWEEGATMVKVFPAKFFGPAYFAEIKGPFNNIELLACGGVSPLNLKDYFSSGADAVSFGASVFKKEWLNNKNFKQIGRAIISFIDAWENYKEAEDVYY